MRGRGMAAGYSQGLCFIPGARVGPVPITANFFTRKSYRLCRNLSCIRALLRQLFNLILYPPRMFEEEILELYSYMWTSNPESCWKKTYQLLPLVFSIVIDNCQLDTVLLLNMLPFISVNITYHAEDRRHYILFYKQNIFYNFYNSQTQ